MSDHVQPTTGDEQKVSSSGLLLSVDPLPGTTGYKLSTDDTDAGRDTTDVAGGDTDATDATDADASDAVAGDTDATDGGGDADESDADGTDLADNVESESGLGGANPLGIGRGRPADKGDSDSGDS